MTDAAPIVELRDVSFSYGGAPVLEDVSMRLEQRDFAFMLGPNGGGKTTLLHLILGLMQPDRGTVRLFGKPPGRTRRRVGYMPQHMAFDPAFPITVEGVTLMGRLGIGAPRIRYKAEDRAAAREALEQVEMADYASRPYSALSGGQRQRALVARALATQPDLLLLDEPTSNIDIHGESEFSALLERLNEQLAILVVSHDIGFTPKSVRKVFCVNRRVFSHPTNKITPEILREVYGEDIHIVNHADHDGHGFDTEDAR